jgi:tricarballylate dehydrogenase
MGDEKKMTRRGFLKGAAAITGGGAAAMALSACSADIPANSEGVTQPKFDKEVDVCVVGGGFGGLVAAASAAEQGASTLLLEASTRVGSTALMSSGSFSASDSPTSVTRLIENAPLADPILGQAFVDAWPKLLEWLDDIEAPLVALERGGGAYYAYQFGGEPVPDGNIKFAKFMEDYAVSVGAEILLQTKAKSLVLDEGTVIGVVATKADGNELVIKAKNIVLACGGLQNNKEMRIKYISNHADLIASRGNPHNTGCGLIMAMQAGGVPSRSQGFFYGHPVPYVLQVAEDRKTWDDNITDDAWIGKANAIFTACQNSGVQYGIVVNMQGKRFFDESQNDLLLNQEIALQTFARAYEIIDSSMRTAHTGKAAVGGTEYLELIKQWGAPLYEANTIDELVDILAAEGVQKGNLLRTIAEYNAAVDTGTTALLEVPKVDANKAEKLEVGPFYAFAVVPGYSYSFGGVQVNAESQVVDANSNPIKGLWAVPGTAGGLQYKHLIGVLSTLLAMARVTGVSAGAASV